MELSKIQFLTSNPQKAKDFTAFGLGVKEFSKDINEILDENVSLVAVYKAKDTELDSIVVEDTSLSVDGAPFWGTEIKHIYEEVQEDEKYHMHKTIWEVALCMKKDEKYYVAKGVTEGVLMYPALKDGYHFNRIFAVNTDSGYIHFELLSRNEKEFHSPRFKALRILSEAIKNNDFSKMEIFENIPNWTGKYQEEKIKKNKIK